MTPKTLTTSLTARIASNKKLPQLLALLILGAAAALPPTVHAQAAAAPASPAKLVTFEVASIRPHTPGTGSYGPGFTDDGMGMHGTNVSGLIFMFTYPNNRRVEGLPPDIDHDSYDIQAKVAESDVPAWKAMSLPQRRLAVKALLEDRFHLKYHMETRPTPGYALVIAKGGIKFKEADPNDKYEHGFKGLDGSPVTNAIFSIKRGVTSAQAMNMQKFAEFLAGPVQHPVLDKTGLTGLYDLTLTFETPSPDGDAAQRPAETSIFTMVQEQLGLKLEPGATVPVEYFVIDHVERPAQN